MRGSRTSTLILTGALGLGSLVGLAAPALAETPAQEGQEMVLVFSPPAPDHDDIAAPAPQPDPQPQPVPGPGEISDVPQDPGPQGPGDIAQPEPEPQPDPQPGPGEIADAPQDPGPVDGPDDLADGGCHATHGCVPTDDCPGPLASCDLTDTPDQPTDQPADEPVGEPQVQGGHAERGALPRTGAGLAVLTVAGGALTGAGTALRRLAKRS